MFTSFSSKSKLVSDLLFLAVLKEKKERSKKQRNKDSKKPSLKLNSQNEESKALSCEIKIEKKTKRRVKEINQTEDNPSKVNHARNKRDKKLQEKKKELRCTLRNPKNEEGPKPSVRRRTKLLSSGESSSTEPMDLSKRRDVVNKTILRMIRRYFSNKYM